MAIELSKLLEGLDSSTISKVEGIIKDNAKELDAKLFIDGDGEHYVPHARFDELVKQRDSANSSIKDYQSQIEELGKQVEAGSKAEATINDLKSKLASQTELAKRATIETRLHPLVKDSIAPVSDLLGFMEVEKILVNEDGTVSGLEEQLKAVRESRSYLFKAAKDDGEEESGSQQGGAGTGNPGNPGRIGAEPRPPKEVGAFGKQIAQAVASRKPNDEQPNFFR